LEFVWKIKGYDGTEKILDQTVTLNDADEAKIISILKGLASKALAPDEISAGLAEVHKDDVGGYRIIRRQLGFRRAVRSQASAKISDEGRYQAGQRCRSRAGSEKVAFPN